MKKKTAAALEYKRGLDNAPRVTAKGKGQLAERIIEIAQKEGVPVREDRDLAALLSMVDVGEEIPPELYKVIAEIFTFLYRVNGRLKED